MCKTTPFHGSYLPDDVQILLKPIALQLTEVEQKEQLIQSGKKHYSEMLSPEYQPSPAYLEIFHQALQANQNTMAHHAWLLAKYLSRKKQPVLVSLARAGTPVGVLLKRILREHFGQTVPHYSISIIRDRGLDKNALRYILTQHDAQGRDIVFIDGWTGKGVIGRELKKWVAAFNQQQNTQICSDLYVLTDISGTAAVSASLDDYLIPSALLNATIGGLISRSVLNETYVGENDFHGCKFYSEWREQDLSLWYIERIMTVLNSQSWQDTPLPSAPERALRQQQSQQFIQATMQAYNIRSINHIKPGIGEAIRVLLRRVPERILVRDRNAEAIKPFLVLAAEKQVPIEEQSAMPYQAVGVISQLK